MNLIDFFKCCGDCGYFSCRCARLAKEAAIRADCSRGVNRHRIAFNMIQLGWDSTHVTPDYLQIGATGADIGRKYWDWIKDLSDKQLWDVIDVLHGIKARRRIEERRAQTDAVQC